MKTLCHVHEPGECYEGCPDAYELDQIVYECWVAGQRDTFAKMKSDDKFALAQHIMGIVQNLQPHEHLHVVAHYASEYEG